MSIAGTQPSYPHTTSYVGSLGPMGSSFLIGVLIGAFFYGILIWQVAFYFNRYPGDSKRMKAFVGCLLMLETAALVLEVCGVYYRTIMIFGLPGVMLIPIKIVQTEAAIVYTVMFITQWYFAFSLWKLSGRRWLLLCVTGFLILVAYGTALMITTIIPEKKGWSWFMLQDVIPANKILETVVDIIITSGLCFYLRRSQSTIQRTNHMVNRLISFSVQRGVTTTFLQICYLVAYKINPDKRAWVAVHTIVSKVYANTAIASLNDRRRIRDIGEQESEVSGHIAAMQFGSTQEQKTTNQGEH